MLSTNYSAATVKTCATTVKGKGSGTGPEERKTTVRFVMEQAALHFSTDANLVKDRSFLSKNQDIKHGFINLRPEKTSSPGLNQQ